LVTPESLTLTKAGRFALRLFYFSPVRVIRGVLHDAFIPYRDFFITVEGKMNDEIRYEAELERLGMLLEEEIGLNIEAYAELVEA